MEITLEQIIAAGVHLGHPIHQWNPKRGIYTYGVRAGTHVVDLVKTRRRLEKARKFVIDVARSGKSILFVGTKSQASCIVKEVGYASKSFFVRDRWLGGMLTHWSTVQASLIQLHRLEREQKNGVWSSLSKKEASLLQTRLDRLKRYLGGLKGIRSLPGAVIIIGQTKELVAIQECRKLKIPIVCRLDTDCDPNLVEFGVPLNDDSRARIRLFLEALVPSIQEGQRLFILKQSQKRKKVASLITMQNDCTFTFSQDIFLVVIKMSLLFTYDSNPVF
jgi:small subunit ribosomal protein S2